MVTNEPLAPGHTTHPVQVFTEGSAGSPRLLCKVAFTTEDTAVPVTAAGHKVRGRCRP